MNIVERSSGSSTAAPLIVTAELPTALQARAEALRRAHYPLDRNHVPAHVTLLRALPPFVEDEARRLLSALAAELPPPPAAITGLLDLGSGTALAIESHALREVRAMIAAHFHGLLTLQDEGEPRLHVTLQNKVPRAEARALQAAFGPVIHTERFAFAGLALHRYRGGPWEGVGRWSFRGRRKR
jgi:hypothetical protein